MPESPLQKRHSPWWRWWPSWLCVWPDSPRSACRCGASMRRVRPRGWAREVMLHRRHAPHRASHRPTRSSMCEATAISSSRGSPRHRRCCRWCRSVPRALPPPRRVVDERGSASLVAAAMCAVLLAVTVGGAQIGATVVARHRAQAAADLAALAGAAAVPAGLGPACAKASTVAQRMATTAVGCSVDDLDLTVTVDAPVSLRLFGAVHARALARAGPA